MFNYNEKLASEKGYYIKLGKIYSHTGRIRKINNSKGGYPKFTIACGSRTNKTFKTLTVLCHRLVAYQKYGNKIYKKGIQVRHKNNNPLNFHKPNILIGTQSKNMMDKPPNERRRTALIASSKTRRFTDEEMNQIRKQRKNGASYKDIMKTWNILSKGTLSYMLTHKYKTVI